MAPPSSGARTGIHAYFQSLSPLCGMGRMACINRGPRSLAGLIAYPVGPPSENPIPMTNKATGRASREPSDTFSPSKLAPAMKKTPKTKVKVPMNSVKKFQNLLRIAGDVQKVARSAAGSSGASYCFL